MLKTRIIPCLDFKNGQVVKGEKFENIVDVGSPENLAEFYNNNGADELVFYDITASNEKRDISLDFVEKIAAKITIPFCVGGGIKTIEDFQTVINKGADKVSISSAAVRNPQLIKDAAEKFGSGCVVLALDVKKNSDGIYKIYIDGGRIETELEAVDWVKKGVALGAGEIVVNSIDQDGMKNGYDIQLLKMITDAVHVPVIASGGAGTKEHFYEAIEQANVGAVLAASVFHFGEVPIPELKDYLAAKGVAVRR